MDVKLKFLVCDNDRHGNTRYYVRRPGQKKIRLTAAPMSAQFLEQYRKAFGDGTVPQMPPANGTFRAVLIRFLASGKFMRLDVSTRGWMRRNLEEISIKYGHLPIAMMETRHVRKIRNEREAHPAAANMRMKSLRSMFGWATEEEIIDNNPTIGVKNIRYTTKGHHSWTPDEVARYQEHHTVGTQGRLAFDLLRYTAARREDIPRLGPANCGGGRLRFRQGKNDQRKPVDVDIPIHPALMRSIEATHTGRETFLVTPWGKPYTTNGFGNRFKEWCVAAGLPHCSAHGVRKSTSTELAEGGASTRGIMSVTGHRSLKEVERYTEATRYAGLANDAISKLK